MTSCLSTLGCTYLSDNIYLHLFSCEVSFIKAKDTYRDDQNNWLKTHNRATLNSIKLWNSEDYSDYKGLTV